MIKIKKIGRELMNSLWKEHFKPGMSEDEIIETLGHLQSSHNAFSGPYRSLDLFIHDED